MAVAQLFIKYHTLLVGFGSLPHNRDNKDASYDLIANTYEPFQEKTTNVDSA